MRNLTTNQVQVEAISRQSATEISHVRTDNENLLKELDALRKERASHAGSLKCISEDYQKRLAEAQASEDGLKTSIAVLQSEKDGMRLSLAESEKRHAEAVRHMEQEFKERSARQDSSNATLMKA